MIVQHLLVLDNTNLGSLRGMVSTPAVRCVDGLGGTYPQYSAIEHESLLLSVEDSVVLLIRLRNHKSSLVFVWVELVAVLTWVEPLQTVLLQCVDKDGLGHLKTIMEVLQLLVLIVEHLLRHGREGAVQVVNAVNQVLCEPLQPKVASGLDFSLGLFLQVAVFCYRALPLVLQSLSVIGLLSRHRYSYGQVERFLLLGL